ncbi:MAG: type VII toxin-antitoxin system MntA family adenylyltransferase antitoxin [Nitrospirota bacterium]
MDIIIKDILEPIFDKHRVLFAYLFGSTSQDNVQPSSDIDIAVFLPAGTGQSYFDIKLSLYADFCRALKRNDIDVIVLNTATNLMLLDDITRHGIIIYERDTDLREDFELKVLHQALDFKKQRLVVMGV